MANASDRVTPASHMERRRPLNLIAIVWNRYIKGHPLTVTRGFTRTG